MDPDQEFGTLKRPKAANFVIRDKNFKVQKNPVKSHHTIKKKEIEAANFVICYKNFKVKKKIVKSYHTRKKEIDTSQNEGVVNCNRY